MPMQVARSKVLIVDDSRTNLFIVEAILKSEYETQVANSGPEALQLIQSGPSPDLILLDIVMPGMDGYQVCSSLKSDPATTTIPIIFLTGQTELEEEVKGFQLGAVDYITKPVCPSTLLARVHTHLENARLFEEKNRVTELLRRSLLPQLSLPHLHVEVGHRFLPSKLLSGDFYDLVELSGDSLGVVMADVAGKGPAAAIQTIRAKYLMRASAQAGLSPGAILQALNSELYKDEEARNLTAFFAILDLAQRTMVYCSAGHEPALLWQPKENRWNELSSTCPLLGAIDPLEPEERQINLEPGATLLLFTDGVSEARTPAGDFLGVEPVLQVATRCVHGSVQELVDGVYEAVEQFAAGKFSDDVSLLALRFG